MKDISDNLYMLDVSSQVYLDMDNACANISSRYFQPVIQLSVYYGNIVAFNYIIVYKTGTS